MLNIIFATVKLLLDLLCLFAKILAQAHDTLKDPITRLRFQRTRLSVCWGVTLPVHNEVYPSTHRIDQKELRAGLAFAELSELSITIRKQAGVLRRKIQASKSLRVNLSHSLADRLVTLQCSDKSWHDG